MVAGGRWSGLAVSVALLPPGLSWGEEESQPAPTGGFIPG